jgi:hypothetical protein
VFAGSNDLQALSLPHVVLRKIVHEDYRTNEEGAPVNDIAVFRVTNSLFGVKNTSRNCRCWSSVLKMEAVCFSETWVSPTSQHGVTSQKTSIDVRTAVRVSLTH